MKLKNLHNNDIIICKKTYLDGYFTKNDQYKIIGEYFQSNRIEIYVKQVKPFIGLSLKILRDDEFPIYFKTLKQIRKEKIEKIKKNLK